MCPSSSSRTCGPEPRRCSGRPAAPAISAVSVPPAGGSPGIPKRSARCTGGRFRADAELILEEDMLATMTYAGGTGADVSIDPDWAAGVAMTLGWVRGALPDNPLSPS